MLLKGLACDSVDDFFRPCWRPSPSVATHFTMMSSHVGSIPSSRISCDASSWYRTRFRLNMKRNEKHYIISIHFSTLAVAYIRCLHCMYTTGAFITLSSFLEVKVSNYCLLWVTYCQPTPKNVSGNIYIWPSFMNRLFIYQRHNYDVYDI